MNALHMLFILIWPLTLYKVVYLVGLYIYLNISDLYYATSLWAVNSVDK